MSFALNQWPGPIVTISAAQLLGTSLWFSANAVTAELQTVWGISTSDVGWLTNAVQAGFILGTLLLSLTGLADRFKASHIFAFSALFGSIMNFGFAFLAYDLPTGLIFRFLVGVSLAGIYPLGMKMMVQWAPEKATWGLSVLVAMLTLGTALPHGLAAFTDGYPWYLVVSASSVLAMVASCIVLVLGDKSSTIQKRNSEAPGNYVRLLRSAFANRDFRCSAFGYFGHMWELYSFWTATPILIYLSLGLEGSKNSALSFAIICAGAIGCVAGGFLAIRFSSRHVAIVALLASGSCCVMFGTLSEYLSPLILIVILLVWGVTVVMDSPQLSSICALNCPPELVGSALALMNSIGFTITIVSIAITTYAISTWGSLSIVLLSLGPMVGVRFMLSLPHDSGGYITRIKERTMK